MDSATPEVGTIAAGEGTPATTAAATSEAAAAQESCVLTPCSLRGAAGPLAQGADGERGAAETRGGPLTRAPEGGSGPPCDPDDALVHAEGLGDPGWRGRSGCRLNEGLDDPGRGGPVRVGPDRGGPDQGGPGQGASGWGGPGQDGFGPARSYSDALDERRLNDETGWAPHEAVDDAPR